MKSFGKNIYLRIMCIVLCCLMLSACSNGIQTPATTVAATTTQATTTKAGTTAATTKPDAEKDVSGTELVSKTVVRDFVLNPKKPILAEYPIKNAPKLTYWVKLLPDRKSVV